MSLGTLLATVGVPRLVRAFPSVPPPSSFTTLLGLCTAGTALATYTPGIKNTLQLVRTETTVTFSPAVPVAQNKAITGYTYSLDEIVSCSNVTDLTGAGTIFYTSGQSSSWTIDSWTVTRLLGQGVGVLSGPITHGPFNGARVWHFGIRATADGSACASVSGVTSSPGTDTFIIAE